MRRTHLGRMGQRKLIVEKPKGAEVSRRSQALFDLIKERLHYWPEGVEAICVSRRNEWMLKHIQGEETHEYQVTETFNSLGRNGAAQYRGMSCNEQQFRELKGMPPKVQS